MDIDLYGPMDLIPVSEFPLSVQSDFESQFCFVNEIYDQFHQRGCMNPDSEMIFSSRCLELVDWMSSRIVDKVVRVFARYCRLEDGNRACADIDVEVPLCLEIDS